MSKKIVFISKSLNNPSTRYRAYQFFNHLKSAGWEPEHCVADTRPLKWLQLLKQASQAEVVVVLRKTLPWIFLKSLRAVSKKLILDIDDAVFVKDDGTDSSIRKKRFQNFVKSCDQVWVGNSYLASNAQSYCQMTYVIPTSVNPSKYLINPEKHEDYFDLVWIGSRSTQKYLLNVIPFIEAAASQIKNIRLKIIADFEVTSPHLEIMCQPWSESEEAFHIATSHVGIAPLVDDAWTRGKCALKIIQYMAAGLPVIASPVGANCDVVVSDVTGLFAHDESTWMSSIRRMYEDISLRGAMGAAGRNRMLELFSVDAAFGLMKNLL